MNLADPPLPFPGSISVMTYRGPVNGELASVVGGFPRDDRTNATHIGFMVPTIQQLVQIVQ